MLSESYISINQSEQLLSKVYHLETIYVGQNEVHLKIVQYYRATPNTMKGIPDWKGLRKGKTRRLSEITKKQLSPSAIRVGLRIAYLMN